MKFHCLIFIMLFIVQSASTQTSDQTDNPAVPERNRDYDALHYKIELTVDPEQQKLEGQNTISIQPLRNNFNLVELDAVSLVVTDVINIKGFPLSFDQTDESLFINLSRKYGHQDTIIFTVKYHLTEPVLGLRFIEGSGNRPLQVSSACFPNKAREWIPCYDATNDKVTQDMIITTSSRFKVLSNGSLLNTTVHSNGTTTWHWNQKLPHASYLINLSIADYLVVEDSLDNLPVNYWVYRSMADDVERVFGKTPYMIDFYNRLYGYKFPWEKYDQVISGYMGGGAEATSATLLGEGIVTDEYTEQDYYREYVIAHEIAHQWWGDLITCRSWEHTWLNESFGTYSDHLYTRYDKGADEGAYDLLVKKKAYLDEAHNRFMRPIVYTTYEQPGDNFNRHTYQKGACTLHLLRSILGDDAFFRTISTFLHRHEFESVTTYDFMKCLKDVTGKNMDWFFEQHFFKPGHPVLNISKEWDETSGILSITIQQEQDKWENVPIYKLPVNLGLYSDQGKIIKKYWIKEKTEIIKIPLDKEPRMVRFDEGNYLLKEWSYKKELEELLFQLENDDMTGRLWAVEQLAEYSDDPLTIDAWKRSAGEDTFWAVRAAAIKQMGEFSPVENLDQIKKATADESSRVRTAAIKALGDLEDPAFKNFFRQTFRTDNSYAVQSEALIAIGKCGSKSDISFLKEAETHKSYRDVVSQAAQKAMTFINTGQWRQYD